MIAENTRPEVVVVTGAGGMGEAIARRLGSGASLVLADFNDAHLEGVAEGLRRVGYSVQSVRTDVSSADDVAALAEAGRGASASAAGAAGE